MYLILIHGSRKASFQTKILIKAIISYKLDDLNPIGSRIICKYVKKVNSKIYIRTNLPLGGSKLNHLFRYFKLPNISRILASPSTWPTKTRLSVGLIMSSSFSESLSSSSFTVIKGSSSNSAMLLM